MVGKTDVIGKAVSKADGTSPGGRAFITRKPVVCANLATSQGFALPSFYADHGIVSTINVLDPGQPRRFCLWHPGDRWHRRLAPTMNDDTNFLTTFANVLAEAVATAHRVERLRVALEEKEVLARELQHRVRNNLHLISGMLSNGRL